MASFQQVHVRINDASTGKPTPCRVRFTDEQGVYYAPFGRLPDFATGYGVDVGGNVLADGKKYAYIDGTCEIALPPGKIIIEVQKGPEYTPLHVEQQLSAGQLSLRLTIERWINMREQGWYSGDARCHFLPPHGALLEGMAEDLAVVNLLAMECQIPETDSTGEKVIGQKWATHNLLAFSGQQPALEAPGHMVVVNTLNWHPWLGRLALLNCHRVVYPLRFGAPDFDDWTLSDWCDQCHRKGGLVVWTEASKHFGEALANALLGKIDAIEIDSLNWDDFESTYTCALLESEAIYLPGVGASGKVSNAQVLGGVRTYARLADGQQLNYSNWIEAVRAGRTFVTKGPLLDLTVNDHGLGSKLTLEQGKQVVHIHAIAQSTTPFHELDVYFPGGCVGAKATGYPARAIIDKKVQLNDSGCIYARCCPTKETHAYDAVAFTSPIQVSVGDHAQKRGQSAGQFPRAELMESIRRVKESGRFANETQRQRLLDIFEHALQRLDQ